ncbi:MAG: hypothetical protein P8X60_05830 [Robiginitalea sp.]
MDEFENTEIMPHTPGSLEKFSSLKKAEGFRKLTKADTRPCVIPRKDRA